MSTKGGLSKQLKNKMPAQRQSVVVKVQRPFTHAGLPPTLYTELHQIPSPSRLFRQDKESLEAQIRTLVKKRDRIQKSFDAATEMAGKFQTNSRNYTDLLGILDMLSAFLTETCQSLTKVEEALASQTASQTLAYRLQLEEVDSHFRFVGRLDLPRPQMPELRPPVRRGLRERSVNVPSPARHHPQARAQEVQPQVPSQPSQPRQPELEAGPSRPLRQPVIHRFLTQQEPSPGCHDKAMLQTPETEVEYRRCTHARLHRLNLSADKDVRRQLRLACKASCGRSTADKYTLWAPLPASRARVTQNVVELPAVTVVANLPPLQEDEDISQSQANENENQDQAEISNETIELHTSPTVELGSSSSSEILQIDGLHHEQITCLLTPPPSPNPSWPSPTLLWSGSPPSSGGPLPPIDDCLGTCLICAPDTPDYLRPDNGDYESSLIKRLNAESFKRIDELKRVKRELFSSPAANEPESDEPESIEPESTDSILDGSQPSEPK